MKRIRSVFEQLGIDGAIVAILGIVAILLSIYDIVGGSQISQPILVGVLGLLLLEVVLQRIRLDRTKSEIIGSLSGAHIEVFSNEEDFADAKYRVLMQTEKYVYDTELCLPAFASAVSSPSPETRYKQLLKQKILNKQIEFRYVQVIYNRRHFESVLEKLFQFCECRYYIGYFLGAPEVIPVMNLMIFDGKHFFIGGYYGPTVRGDDRNVYTQSDLMGATLQQYYDYLWKSARLFNDKHGINWEEIQHCGQQLGYDIEELNSTIARIAKSVGFSRVKVFAKDIAREHATD